MSQIRRTGSSGPVNGVVYDFAAYRARQTGAAGGAEQIDKSAVSENARELNRARAAVESAPDVRSDRISELRSSIEDGTYQPDPQVIAKSILSRGL